MVEKTLWRTFLVAVALLAPPCGALAQNVTQLDGTPIEPSVRSNIAAQIESSRNSAPEEAQGKETPGGPAVDAAGNPANDPTANVLALTRAATQRQDDLRNASERFILAQIEASEKLNVLRSDSAKQLREAETRRINEVLELRSDFQKQLAEAEAKRIDAIRTVDVNAVLTATERTSGQADVLAQQVSDTAETARVAVASTSQGFTDSLQRTETALSTRIAALEAAQNVGQGRQAFSDPAFTELTNVVKQLVEAQNLNAGRSGVTDPALAAALEEIKAIKLDQSSRAGVATGASNLFGYIAVGISGFVGLITIGGFVAMLRRPPAVPIPVNGNGNGQANYNRRKAA